MGWVSNSVRYTTTHSTLWRVVVLLRKHTLNKHETPSRADVKQTKQPAMETSKRNCSKVAALDASSSSNVHCSGYPYMYGKSRVLSLATTAKTKSSKLSAKSFD